MCHLLSQKFFGPVCSHRVVFQAGGASACGGARPGAGACAAGCKKATLPLPSPPPLPPLPPHFPYLPLPSPPTLPLYPLFVPLSFPCEVGIGVKGGPGRFHVIGLIINGIMVYDNKYLRLFNAYMGIRSYLWGTMADGYRISIVKFFLYRRYLLRL